MNYIKIFDYVEQQVELIERDKKRLIQAKLNDDISKQNENEKALIVRQNDLMVKFIKFLSSNNINNDENYHKVIDIAQRVLISVKK